MSLTYPYRSTSTLPRRSFLVNVVARTVRESRAHLALEVTAPDAVAAETVARVAMSRNPDVLKYEFTLVREVTTVYNAATSRYDAPLVKVPDTFRHALTVRHR